MSVQLLAIGSLYATDRGPGGVAAEASAAALAAGADALAASRVGMDRFGRELVDALRARRIDTTTVQTDPDLPTPRFLRRGELARIEPYAAFDTLQWDSDLEAATRMAEAIVTDACGRRHGQARSTIDRVLIAAPSALRAIDLVARPAGQEAKLDRDQVGNAIELCDLFVLDPVAVRTVTPAASDDRDGIRRLRTLAPKATVLVVQSKGLLVGTAGGAMDLIEAPDGASPIPSLAWAVHAALAMVRGHALMDALPSAWKGSHAS